MPSPATITRVKALLRRELRLGDNEEIADDTPLKGGDFDLDSLDMLLIVTAVEKEFGIKIREQDAAASSAAGEAAGAAAFRDVTSLAAFIEARAGEGGASGAAGHG